MIGTECGLSGPGMGQARATKTIASNPYLHWSGLGGPSSLTIIGS